MASAAAARRSSIGASGRGAGVVGHVQERGQRGEADELGLGELDAVLGRELADGLPGLPQRRDPEVEQVHRHLGADRVAALGLLDAEAVALEPGSPPPDSRTRRAMRFASSTSSESRLMFQAIRNGRAPDGHRAGPRVHPGGPEVRLAPVLADLDLEALVLAAADVGELHPVRARGRLRRRGRPAGRSAAAIRWPEGPGELDAVVDRRVAERARTGRRPRRRSAGARPRARPCRSRRSAAPTSRSRPADDGLVLAGHGEHRAVVARVRGAVEEVHARGPR